jgi:hypothetical protein
MTRQRNTSQNPVIITRGQLINWAARLARIAWSTEHDAEHQTIVNIAMEMKNISDSYTTENKLGLTR